ncbi:MAG: hypothetical protein DLM72_17190 [Candidatus Nitrosopolaris wilkensis]|nr:MAG: hypothetical protein DLM72_17190 [Candidatus Nitrosopolaris wilkensis]
MRHHAAHLASEAHRQSTRRYPFEVHTFEERLNTILDRERHAVGCIRNGLAAAVLATQHGVSQDLIKSILGGAAGLTGCGGIADINQISNAPMFQQLLQILAQNVK